jgi:hypothetical protein
MFVSHILLSDTFWSDGMRDSYMTGWSHQLSFLFTKSVSWAMSLIIDGRGNVVELPYTEKCYSCGRGWSETLVYCHVSKNVDSEVTLVASTTKTWLNTSDAWQCKERSGIHGCIPGWYFLKNEIHSLQPDVQIENLIDASVMYIGNTPRYLAREATSAWFTASRRAEANWHRYSGKNHQSHAL